MNARNRYVRNHAENSFASECQQANEDDRKCFVSSQLCKLRTDRPKPFVSDIWANDAEEDTEHQRKYWKKHDKIINSVATNEFLFKMFQTEWVYIVSSSCNIVRLMIVLGSASDRLWRSRNTEPSRSPSIGNTLSVNPPSNLVSPLLKIIRCGDAILAYDKRRLLLCIHSARPVSTFFHPTDWNAKNSTPPATL